MTRVQGRRMPTLEQKHLADYSDQAIVEEIRRVAISRGRLAA